MTVKPQHLGGDRYRIRVYDATRKRQLSKVYRAKNMREAKSEASKYDRELREAIRETKALRGTVAGLVAEWKRELDPTASQATIYRRDAILRAIIAGLGHHQLADLSPRHIDHWLNELRAENIAKPKGSGKERYRSEATIHHYYRQLAAVLAQGAEWGDVDKVVTRRVRKPKATRTEIDLPTTEDLTALIESAPQPLRTMAKFAAHTGMRRGELCALRWSDLDASGSLHIRETLVDVPGQPLRTKPPKTGRSRRITIEGSTIDLLVAHRQWLEAVAEHEGVALPANCPMFPTVSRVTGVTWTSPGKLSAAWRAHCKRAGASVRFHDMRHWMATSMLAAGQPLHAVSDRLGHTLPSTTTNIYGHREKTADRALAREVAALLP